jgi:hypothetical protein
MADEEKTDVSLAGIKITLGSSKVAAAVGKVLVDSVSPISEALGYIGDRIRIYREENVLAAIEGSRRKLQAAGIAAKSPSPSFLIPYLEKVGIGYEDEGMQDRWENLLVAAAAGKSQEKTAFIDVLGKLSGRDAQLFDDIAFRPVVNIGTLNQIEDAAAGRSFDSLRNTLSTAPLDVRWKNLCASLVLRTERRGAAFLKMFVYDFARETEGFYYSRKGLPDGDLEELAERLRILGLVNLIEADQVAVGDCAVTALSAYISYFGAEFFFSTHNPEFRKAPSVRTKGVEYPDLNCLPATGDTFHSPKVLSQVLRSKSFKAGLELNHRTQV